MSTHDDPDRHWVVALVDDDRKHLHDYKTGLETFCRNRSNLEIVTFVDAQDAVKAVEQQDTQGKMLWIVDSMMPFDGEGFDMNSTNQGLLTGIVLLKRIVASSKGSGSQRYLVMTNHDVNVIREELSDVEIEDVHSKLSCSPKKLSQIVDDIIETAARS